MATDNSGELNDFLQFANTQLQAGAKLSPEEVVEQWREAHPLELMADDEDEIAALVQEALDDIAAGDRGIPFDEHLAEIEKRFGLKPTPKNA